MATKEIWGAGKNTEIFGRAALGEGIPKTRDIPLKKYLRVGEWERTLQVVKGPAEVKSNLTSVEAWGTEREGSHLLSSQRHQEGKSHT